MARESYYGSPEDLPPHMLLRQPRPPMSRPGETGDVATPETRPIPYNAPMSTGRYPHLGLPETQANNDYYPSLEGMSQDELIELVYEAARERLGREPGDEQEAISEAWTHRPSDGVGTGIDVLLNRNPQLRSPFGSNIDPRSPAGTRDPIEHNRQDNVEEYFDPELGTNTFRFVPDRR